MKDIGCHGGLRAEQGNEQQQSTTDAPRISVIIPTYNRDRLLIRALSSIAAQDYRDFEIVVIDDGSTDQTASRVWSWATRHRVAVRYFCQSNLGTHAAYNTGIRHARGELIVILGSDDLLAAGCLSKIAQHWSAIDPGQRHRYCGVVGHGAFLHNDDLVGEAYPQDVFDLDHIRLVYQLRERGDKPGAWRRDILLQNLYPVFPGERFMFDTYALKHMGSRYLTRYVNEVFHRFDYQSDGITARRRQLRRSSPQGMALYFRDDANIFTRGCRFALRHRAHAHYVYYALLAAQGPLQQWRNIDSRSWWLIAMPSALLTLLRDWLRSNLDPIGPRLKARRPLRPLDRAAAVIAGYGKDEAWPA